MALQGTPSLFLVIWGRRALGFGSCIRGEREQCLHCFGFIYLFIIIFIYFIYGDPKIGYNRCPLFIILTEQGFCVVSFIKINKTKLPN